jgi:pimeloyl-ACP methyl ester carboxylesterase
MSSVDSRSIPAQLGHELVGSGLTRVIVTNDWLCDTSTWDGARAYLDAVRFTFAFADLRGYGRSRGLPGTFTVLEAAADVLTLADALGWDRFAIVGHSMSSLVTLHLAQQRSDRIDRVVVLAPPPPAGFGADEAALSAARAIALADDATRLSYLAERFAARLSPGWAAYKTARWRAAADPAAVAAYVSMFARDGLPDLTTRISVPVLAVTGEQDAPPMRSDSITQNLAPLCEHLAVMALRDCGHYPMQEMPPLTVALVERFLGAATVIDA